MGYIQEPQSQPLLKRGVPQESRLGEGEVGAPQAPVFRAAPHLPEEWARLQQGSGASASQLLRAHC